MPVVHVIASVFGSLVLTPPGSLSSDIQNSLKIEMDIRPISKDLPNVVVVVHESLSGELMTGTDEYNVPFYQKMAASKDQGFYVFENARSASGDTIDCMTAIQSGCLPLDDKEGMLMALNTTLGSAFKSVGYHTASFSSSRSVSCALIQVFFKYLLLNGCSWAFAGQFGWD